MERRHERVILTYAAAATIAFGCAGAVPRSGAAAAQVFAPGIVSGPADDASPAFAPDGKAIYFARSGDGTSTVLESHLVKGRWSRPEIAPFSGRWSDQHPSMAPDGSYVIFVSTRPVPGTAGHVANLWRVDRTARGWSAPRHLPATVNIGRQIFAPSVAADGTIYFLSISRGGSFQLYDARYRNGSYEAATRVSFSTPATADVDPQIAPDGTFIVFASSGRSGAADTFEHLFVAAYRNGTWTNLHRLRYRGDEANGGSNDNEPRLSPDGRRLYFTSDRTLPIRYPRTRPRAQADLARIQSWDNGNTNVWSLPFAGPGS
ncbi:MAG TPA: hypothetical protein VMF61_07105 [Candidatus Acidoferrales bacterium]|nr:hypothetical protein [Candidatus Acidoferrales bacterium]